VNGRERDRERVRRRGKRRDFFTCCGEGDKLQEKKQYW
jgi:hypothetical protein